MAVLQLHGLVPPQTVWQSAQTQHELLLCGRVTALISHLPGFVKLDQLSVDEATQWAMKHHAILAAYSAHTTVVPISIGAVFSSKSAISDEVQCNIDQYVDILEALRDIREFNVKLIVTGKRRSDAPPPQSGRHFLQLRRDRRDGRHGLYDRRQTFAQDIHKHLQAHTTQIRPSGAPKPDHLLNCVILITIQNVTELHRMARQFHEPAQALGLDFVISGPWPTYSSGLLKTLQSKASNVISA